MTKPRKSNHTRSQKAPKAHRPEAPFASAPPVERQSRGSRGAVREGHGPVKHERGENSSPVAAQAGKVVSGAQINRRAAERLRSGYLWVYASDIEAVGFEGADAPALLPVADNRGLLLGTALYSPSSQIALRMVSPDAIDES